MSQDELISLLAQAVSNKKKALTKYQKISTATSDKEIRQIIMGLINREQYQLDSLNSIFLGIMKELKLDPSSETNKKINLIKAELSQGAATSQS